MTLVEMAVSVAILGILFGIAFYALSNGYNLYISNMTLQRMRIQAKGMLDRIVQDLDHVPHDQIVPYAPMDSDSLKFRKIVSIDEEGRRILSTPIEWAFDLSSNQEIENGLDDNGNGLCDEGNLVRREYDSEGNVLDVVVCGSHVMKRDPTADSGGRKGISFTQVPSSKKIQISLSLEKIDPVNQEDPITQKRKTIKVNLKTMVVLR